MKTDRQSPLILGNGFTSLVTAFVVLAGVASGRAQMLVTPDRTNAVYEAGDIVRWRVEWKGNAAAPAARYRLLRGGLAEVGRGDLKLTNSVADILTQFDSPGTMLVEVKWPVDGGQEKRALGGAVAAPARIPLSASPPEDFEDFWKSKLKELRKVPANPQLESADSGKPNVDYWKITMDNIRGSHIYGQLARPKQGKKLPALLIVQWAGVYRLSPNWVTDRAAEGWLVLNIQAHDLPIDQPDAFYKEQAAGPLKDYPSIGNTNRETSYFLRMYLSCYRAADYLTERRDWDGKTLVVTGGSQGGLQALMTAGLHPEITAAIASVPAGCDMLGPAIGRQGGWPHWYSSVQGRHPEQVREASRYFDVANFTPQIHCPVLVGIGLIDETCPPAGILAAVNQVRAPKEVVLLPKGAHNDDRGTHAAFDRRRDGVWLPALRQGQSVPPKASKE
jgi:cephalosporin-C deacetylase